MAGKISIERTINSILRVLIFTTIVIIAVSVLAILFDFNALMDDKLSRPSNSTGLVAASVYQGEITWAIERGQDTSFTFIQSYSEDNIQSHSEDNMQSHSADSIQSYSEDSEDITFIKVQSVAT